MLKSFSSDCASLEQQVKLVSRIVRVWTLVGAGLLVFATFL
ncbi:MULTISPECIES: hypothetical protein [Hymenobacter]|nr:MULTISPECIES: hypothetical protein [Hymenobacter]